MKEFPILFSGEMVRAILEDRKTQTRWVVKVPPPDDYGDSGIDVQWAVGNIKCPYGQPGDRLWVRESLRGDGMPGNRRKGIMRYAADGEMVMVDGVDVVWQFKKLVVPSIHMPRWASRITLEIVNVRIERLQEISEDDAKAEGVEPNPRDALANHITAFFQLWDSINIHRGFGCDTNPWVWVIEFKRVRDK